jgi:hypothetical protein
LGLLESTPDWSSVPTLARLALALGLGMLTGIEREPYALLAIGLLGVLLILLTVETFRTGEGAEVTHGDGTRGGGRRPPGLEGAARRVQPGAH